MKKATLRATASAFALLGAGFTTAAMVAAPAAAQDYTSAALAGNVTDESGAAIEGATVQLVSLDLGFTRSASSNSSGAFRFTAVPAGNYDLVVSRDGAEVYRAEGIRLLASQSANVSVVLEGGAEEVIVVEGSTLINDFEGTTLGLNVDVEELVKTVPIGRDLTSVVLLAPGTTQGDSSFGNLASIGGSSVAENAYYLNGLNTTNFDNYLGSARVPFDMYRSVEVKSGGYPAEYGRATGGIVNAVTKSGSNDFFGAVHLNWSPNWARSQSKATETCNSSDVCRYTNSPAFDSYDSYSAVIEAGGPLIRDRLFLYGLVEFRETTSFTGSESSGLANEVKQADPFWGLKVDAYPVESQHLEFTIFDTRRTTESTIWDFTADGLGGEVGQRTGAGGFSDFGGVSYVGKWTGNFSDALTLSAAYGKMRDTFENDSKIIVGYARHLDFTSGAINGVPYPGYYTAQTTTSVSSPYNTEREFYRADADLYFNLFGDHHIRAGFDVEKNTLSKATTRSGGQWLFDNGYLTEEAFNANFGNGGYVMFLRPPSGADPRTQVEVNYYNSAGYFDSKNSAFYIQDEWDVTDRLTLNLGLRRDDFTVRRADGELLTSLKENYAPRLGFTYDLWPERNGKLYGYYGQYYLPIASNTSFRMAGNEFYFRERYYLDGFDNNNLPILDAANQVTDDPTYNSVCPLLAVPGVSSGLYCSVTGDGTVADTAALVAANLETTKETEWLVGYEHDFGGFQVGISYVNRKLNQTAEDSAIDAAVNAYCAEQGLDCTTPTLGYDIWTGYHQYTLWNPGGDLTVKLDGGARCVTEPGACATVTFSADELGYPVATRSYDAVELTFRRPFDGVWGLGGSYTWSRSKGNTEGFVQSDFGQSDAGITQDYDQPGFTDGAYGRLPNDRTHRFKLFGNVSPTERLGLGANLSVESPRPLSCFGYHPTDTFANGYGAASHYCNLQLSPRGEGSETDWTATLDLQARYEVPFGNDRSVRLRFDVFNVLNSQAVTNRNEFGDGGIATRNPDRSPATVRPNPNYDRATSYQTPRSIRFGMDISF